MVNEQERISLRDQPVRLKNLIQEKLLLEITPQNTHTLISSSIQTDFFKDSPLFSLPVLPLGASLFDNHDAFAGTSRARPGILSPGAETALASPRPLREPPLLLLRRGAVTPVDRASGIRSLMLLLLLLGRHDRRRDDVRGSTPRAH